MEQQYYVHITNWQKDGQDYEYDGQIVGTFGYATHVDDVLQSFLKSNVNEGYSSKSLALLKTDLSNLEKFKEEVSKLEIESTRTYELNSLLECAESELKSLNIRLRYRKSIHFCESILEKEAVCENTISKASQIIERLEENEILCEEYSINEDEGYKELGILGRKRVASLREEVNDTLDSCKFKLDKLSKVKSTLLDYGVSGLERTLAKSGYNAPILKTDF